MKLDKTTAELAIAEGCRTISDDLASDSTFSYPLGCPSIDIPMGNGVAAGRVYEILGEESHGKTTLALEMTKAFAKHWADLKDPNYNILWIESESSLDVARAKFMGCPVEKFLIYETDVFEHGRDKIRSLLERCKKKGLKLFVVWDTIAATSTLKEKEMADIILEEGDEDDDKKKKSNPGGLVEKPRLIRQMFRDITVALGETNSTFVIVNQMTTQIGRYGAPLDSSGGKGLRHHASVRVQVAKIDDGREEIMPNGKRMVKSIIVEFRYKKNKLTGFTNLPTQVYIDKDTGINMMETRMLFLKEQKIVPPVSGSWTTMKIPIGYADKTLIKAGVPYTPGLTEIKWQGTPQLEALIKDKYPHLIDWFDYQTYLTFGKISSLIKAKVIDKIWDYESKFFGRHVTELTAKEHEVSEMMFADLVAAQDAEDAKTQKNITKESAEKKTTAVAKPLMAKTAAKAKDKNASA